MENLQTEQIAVDFNVGKFAKLYDFLVLSSELERFMLVSFDLVLI